MLSVAKGYDVAYLLGPVASGRESYYTGAVAAGEPPGRWYGAGSDELGLRGQVDGDLMEAIYRHLLDPRDEAAHSRSTWGEAQPLANGHRQYRSAKEIYEQLIAAEPDAGPERRKELESQAERSARQAVAFFDATFSAPKSVSVLGTAFERAANNARRAGDERAAEAWATHARAVEEAVMAGARATLDYLQDVAGYSRAGHHGGGAGRYIDAHGWIAAQFLQHDSRDRDPQLHVHQAVLNRVRCADGTWRTLDGQAIYRHRLSAGAVGERVMEAHLSRVLGVRFETRPDGKAREIVGVRQEVMDLFSSRRRAISDKVAELVKAYEERHGRPPSVLERKHIAQEATLSTRRAKSHDGETLEERLDRWEREARGAVAGGLAEVAREALAQGRRGTAEPAVWSPKDVVERAVAEVGKNQQTWTRSDLMWAVSNALPAHLGIEPEEMRPLLEKLTDQALEQALVVKPKERTEDLPDELKLADGRSAYEAPGSARYTTEGQVAAERILQEAAVRTGAATLTAEQADAVIARYAVNGRELSKDQAAAVRGVLTSGAMVELMPAAAGAGKSFTIGVIGEAWAEHGRRLIAVTPSQRAAEVLLNEGVEAYNIDQWKALIARDESMQPRAGDILVVDEAGMANTPALADVVQRAEAAGAKLLATGDHRQLAAVGPGGALADLGKASITYELTKVWRFQSKWEAEASLRVRDGDAVALEQYDKHGRLHSAGTPEQAQQEAERAWLADTLAGKESLLLVDSNEAANSMSARIRAQLVRLGRVAEEGLALGWDGNTAGVGDMVRARKNAWHLKGYEGNERAPINQSTYKVVETRPDGSMRVAPALGRGLDGTPEFGAPLTLPADYVNQHVSLAYASTVYGAQGSTVDTAHTVVAPRSNASSVYVGLTRGREANHAWIITQPTPSDAPVGEAQDVEPRPAKAVLAEVLERAEEQRGALAEQEQAAEDAASTLTNVDRLLDGLAQVNAGRTSATLDRLTASGVITLEQRQELAADRAMGSVERLLRHAEVAGHDPEQVLRGVLDGNSLDGAHSPGRVLHKRIRDAVGDLAPRITSYTDLIPRGLDERWERHLTRLAEASDDRRRELGTRLAQAEELPKWALDTLGPVPEDPIGRAEWEHRAGWAADHRENAKFEDEEKPLGVAPPAGLPEKRAVWWTAHDALGLPDIGPEEDSLPDGRLLSRWAAWEREQAWAPRYVEDELAATSEKAAARKVDAELWAARAETLDDPEEAQQLRDAAREAREEVEALEQQAVELEEVDKARAKWFAHTATTRDLAMRSKAALEARGVDVEHPEDATTAREWLAAQEAGQKAEDPHRVIHETDVVVEREETPLVDGVLVETAVPDIRETATADPTESKDPDPRRQVPAPGDTAAWVARARDTLAEIAARHEADEARDAHAASERVAWWAADHDDARVRVDS